MEADGARRLIMVVDADVDRLVAMRRGVDPPVPDTAVFLLDAAEGRVVLAWLADVLTRPGIRHAVVLVRAHPESWVTAALLAAVRFQREYGQVEVVVSADVRRDMLPVLITDFPGLRVVSPSSDPCAVVAGVIGSGLGATPS
ncbi:MAG TPA: hypothetical protein VJ870_19495 [Amycolatopsis sp.]|nr:hypothetical protein [Amycolatopsis sp.]